MSSPMATRETFQQAMKNCLDGKPDDAASFADTITTSGFYQVINGNRLERDTYVKHLADWRGKTSDYIVDMYV